MHIFSSLNIRSLFLAAGIFAAATTTAQPVTPAPTSAPAIAPGTETATLTLDLTKPGPAFSAMHFGLMTEEINHSYDGGLYAELIQNRIFKDDPQNPAHWSMVGDASAGTISLDDSQPINAALTTCLKLVVKNSAAGAVGVANEGYWGFPIKPNTTYRASFYAKGDKSVGPLLVSLQSADGKTTYAKESVPGVSDQWQRYTVSLTTSKDQAPALAERFVISAQSAGTVCLNLVSLFPPTFHDRLNGNRIDIMQLLAEMKPSFLRFPGGNFLEGDHIDTRFKWKETIGDISTRPGHPGCWKYRASDGLGLLEFCEWCEDIHMEPLLAVYAGYSLRQEHVDPGEKLQPFVDEALEEIEYVTGDTNTKWGAERAKDGHPEPFKLSYVEIGNEDWFDRSGTYDGRFAQIYDAIKAKYPQLKLIATAKVNSRKPDLLDEHFYRSAMQMEDDAAHYDRYSRSGPEIFVGEWATREGDPTTNLNAALGDAAWMTGMERNADIVVMQCYAPLFVNVSPGAMQWKSDLIGYDASSSYGSPSYYAQKMFSTNHGDTIVAVTADKVPAINWLPPKRRNGEQPPAKDVPTLFCSATRSASAGTIFLKIVNTSASPQSVHVNLKGVAKVESEGDWIILTSADAHDTNTITSPTKIIPVSSKVQGIGESFDRQVAPLSVNVLKIQAQ